MAPRWPPDPPLLECPFCSGIPVWRERSIQCLHCGIIFYDSECSGDRQWVAGKWNRRAVVKDSPHERAIGDLTVALHEWQCAGGLAQEVAKAIYTLVNAALAQRGLRAQAP